MRPIDADVMRNEWLENGENEYVYDTNSVLESIDQQPTLDAVPVVRCKDCKSFKEYTPEFKASNECVEGADGDCITRLLYSDAHPQFSAVRNSDYCSLGVKNNLEE